MCCNYRGQSCSCLSAECIVFPRAMPESTLSREQWRMGEQKELRYEDLYT